LNISKDISEKISCIDWQKVIEEMNENGYGLVLRLLPGQCCEELISKYDNSNVANTWMKVLDIQREFPNQFDEFQRLCHDKNQSKPILKYGKGGYNTLHQDLYGDIFSLFNWFYS
jgi:uncharacterized protein